MNLLDARDRSLTSRRPRVWLNELAEKSGLYLSSDQLTTLSRSGSPHEGRISNPAAGTARKRISPIRMMSHAEMVVRWSYGRNPPAFFVQGLTARPVSDHSEVVAWWSTGRSRVRASHFGSATHRGAARWRTPCRPRLAFSAPSTVGVVPPTPTPPPPCPPPKPPSFPWPGDPWWRRPPRPRRRRRNWPVHRPTWANVAARGRSGASSAPDARGTT